MSEPTAEHVSAVNGLAPSEAFEIKAEAFRLMTGYTAPGKSMPMAAGVDDERRYGAWEVWDRAYGDVVSFVLTAHHSIMPRDNLLIEVGP